MIVIFGIFKDILYICIYIKTCLLILHGDSTDPSPAHEFYFKRFSFLDPRYGQFNGVTDRAKMVHQ